MKSVVFTQSSGDYAQRTRECVGDADLTVAMMVDPGSPGERLTRRLAGDRYCGFDLLVMPERKEPPSAVIAKGIVDRLRVLGLLAGGDVTLNIAGNRIAIFERHGYSQEGLNLLLCDVFLRVRESLDAFPGVRLSVLCGGQSGGDLAGAIGALANGMATRVHAPKGWAYSGSSGVTVYDENGFKQRFDDRVIEAYAIHVGNTGGIEGPVFEPMFHNRGPWLRSEVEADRYGLYLFGDNMNRSSGGGVISGDSDYARMYGGGRTLYYPNVTAAVIRGLDNAMPVCTQHWYRKGADFTANRWQDADLDEFKAVIGQEFRNIKEKFVNGGYHYVVLPENGFFDSRIANISRSRCPALYDALSAELDSLRAFVGQKRVRFQWSRHSDNGYELSSRGDRRFSAFSARMQPGTVLFGQDVGGMSVEEIYQRVVKRSGKGLAPAEDSMVSAPGISRDLAEELSYRKGYLPIWLEWSRQNPVYVDRLRIMAAGKVLTDAFASTNVSQARAMADILNGDAPRLAVPFERRSSVGEDMSVQDEDNADTVKVDFSPEVRNGIFLVERAAARTNSGIHSVFEFDGSSVHVGYMEDSDSWYCRVEGKKGYLLSSFDGVGFVIYDSFESGYDVSHLVGMFRGLVENAEKERMNEGQGVSCRQGLS